MKYIVEFQFRTSDGSWVDDYFDNNGELFCLCDAEYIAQELNCRTRTRYAVIVPMEV